MEVPKWFDDPEAPWPCPCGLPPVGQMVMVETESGSKILAHEICLKIFEKYTKSDETD